MHLLGMASPTEEAANTKIRLVLEKIKHNAVLSMREDKVFYKIEAPSNPNDGFPTQDEQKMIIKTLHYEDALNVRWDYTGSSPYGVDSGDSHIARLLGLQITGCYLEIKQPTFDRMYDRYQQALNGKTALPDQDDPTEFLPEKCVIIWKGKICILTPHKNEFAFCNKAYSIKVLELIEWQEMYESMTGEAPTPTAQEKKMVYDTMKRLNDHVHTKLGIADLFEWKSKNVRRRL